MPSEMRRVSLGNIYDRSSEAQSAVGSNPLLLLASNFHNGLTCLSSAIYASEALPVQADSHFKSVSLAHQKWTYPPARHAQSAFRLQCTFWVPQHSRFGVSYCQLGTGQRNPHCLLLKLGCMIRCRCRSPFAHNMRLKERRNFATGPLLTCNFIMLSFDLIAVPLCSPKRRP